MNMGSYGDWYVLTNGAINALVEDERMGNYLLGIEDSDGKVTVKYIGRSDTDLASRLKDHVKEYYTYFAFRYAPSKTAAYRQECQDYHYYYNNLDNKIHPDAPSNINRICPVCGRL